MAGAEAGSKRIGDEGAFTAGESTSTKRQRRTPRTYVPRYRSGSYAILIALSQQRDEFNQQYATKEEIIRVAQNYCNASFDMPEPGKSYTAWNSIKILLDKGYVWKHGNPAKYMLTESGAEMASHLRNANQNGGSHSQAPPSSLSQLIEEAEEDEDESEEEIDLSLYVLNPEKYKLDNTQQGEKVSTPIASSSKTSQFQSTTNVDTAMLSVSQSSLDNDILLSTQPGDSQPRASQTHNANYGDNDDDVDNIIILDSPPPYPPPSEVSPFSSTLANLPLPISPSHGPAETIQVSNGRSSQFFRICSYVAYYSRQMIPQLLNIPISICVAIQQGMRPKH